MKWRGVIAEPSFDRKARKPEQELHLARFSTGKNVFIAPKIDFDSAIAS
jgi:hypothetical protein